MEGGGGLVESFFCPFVLNPDHVWVDIKFSNLISFREEVSIHFLWLLTAPRRFTMCLSVLAPSVKTILSLLV